jgi:hypothetical protein
VSALALENPIHRTRAIVLFGILGVVGFILTVLTYEQTSGVPHITDLVDWIRPRIITAWEILTWAMWRPSVGMLATFVVGLILGPFSIWLYLRSKRRNWHSSYDIFKLADPELMKDAEVAEEKVQKLSEGIRELQIERERLNLGIPFGSGPISEEPEYKAKLREAARDASAKNLALHELREKARRNALGDIYEKLKEEKLIAKGFKDPLGLHPKENEIPAAYWKFLKFSGDYKEAEGKGIKYTAIEIARK